MEKINWKDKAKEIFALNIIANNNVIEIDNNDGSQTENERFITISAIDAMIEFAKLACIEQKKICSKVQPGYPKDEKPGFNIMNAPTVKFD